MSFLPAPARMRRKALVVLALPLVLLSSLLTAAPATALGTSLTVVQTEWSLNGLDSNNVTSGPNQFTTGAKVCNTSGVAVSGVTATWVWDEAVANINLDSPALKTIGTLAANTCKNLWWTTEITRTTAAWNTSRDFHVTATAPTETSVQTTAGREIYVDKIQSQARNGVTSLSGPTTVYVGDTVTYTMNGFTATGGYTDLEAGPILDGTLFDVQSVSATYVKPTDPTLRTTYFADGCGWDANPASAGYRDCSLPNNQQVNYGGDPIVVTVTAKVLAAGTGSVTSLILDASGASSHYNAAPTSINVTALAADPPVAVDDAASVVIGSNVAINVPSNDTDANGDLALTSVTITGAASHGTTSVNATTGVVTYTPTSPTYVGTDTFTYQICDAGNRCDTALVTVTIVGPPDAVNDSAAVLVGSNVAINVPANDTDPDGDLALTSVTITGAASHGTTSVNATTGVVTYTPTSPSYVGTDTFNYRICDSGSRCDIATVTVTITAGPLAVADSATVVVGSNVAINVPSNDSDLDGDLALTSVTITGAASHGTTSVNPTTGVVTYTPSSPTYVGTDTFTYRICDSASHCTTALVTVTIVAPPVAVADSATVVVGSNVAINVPSNDSDLDGDLALTSVTITGAASHGTTSVNPTTGVVTYTPSSPTYVGTDTFTYRICDSGSRCTTAVATVTIVAPPVAVADSATVVVGSNVAINVPSNDSDLDNDLALTSVTITVAASHGTTSVNPTTGVVTYTPTSPTFVGADTFTYQICDTGNRCTTALVTVTIVAPPVANNDSATVVAGSSVAVPVPSNDTDLDNDLALTSVTITSPASHGTLFVNPATGVVTFTATSSTYVGTDSFEYSICDTGGRCDTAVVALTIVAPPVAVANSAATLTGVSVTIDVAANDTDLDGDLNPGSVSIVTGAAHGSVTVEPVTGKLHYTSDAGWVGTDTIEYRICDLGGRCATALVTVIVTAPPVAVDNTNSTLIDTPVSTDVVANDSDLDVDLDVSSVAIVTDPVNGTITSIVDGVITYAPDSGFVGADTFVYEICDTEDLCDTATVTIIVSALTGPVAVDDSASGFANADLVINVPENDSDPDDNLDPTNVSIVTPPANGSYSIDPVTGSVTYTPNTDFVGVDTFEYEICDEDAQCDIALVTVTITAPPVALDDLGATLTGIPVTVAVASNDSDLDGDLDPTSVSIESAPSNGSVDPGTGEIEYTPNAGFVGTDTFTYKICDSAGNCDVATVAITVTAPPVAVADSATVVVGSNVAINVPANDSDLDGDLALTSVTITVAAAHGTTAVNATTGVVTYTPTSPTFVGTDTFTYRICDSASHCTTALVTVTIVAPPVAVADSATVVVGSNVAINVPANDSDLDGDLALTSVTITVAAAHGTTSVNPTTGVVTYTPSSPTYVGTDTFTYRICDTGSRCTTAVVTVTIVAPPVAVADSATVVVGSNVAINVPSNDSDLDGDLALTSVTITGAAAHGTTSVNPTTGVVTYTPTSPTFVGADTFTYQICDTGNRCTTAVVTVTIVAPPVANDNSDSTLDGVPVTIDVPANDTDLDSDLDLTSVELVSGPAHGSVLIDGATGEIEYSPVGGYVGTDSFVYKIFDLGGRWDTAIVTITITAPPVANDNTGNTLSAVSVTVDVPANDTDLDGDLDLTSVQIMSGPSHGSASRNPATGTITYTSDPGYVGTDTIVYKICDLAGNCDQATLTITVSAPPAPPVAGDNSVVATTAVPVLIDVPLNDSDVDGDLDVTSVNVTVAAAHGTTSVDAVTGKITYTSAAGYVGVDTFSYEICDLGDRCDTALVTVTISAVPPVLSPPVAVDDSESTMSGVPVLVNVPLNDSDVDGDLDTTSVSVTIAAANGSTSVNPVTGRVMYTPNASFVGTDTFTYKICDSQPACDTAVVTITVTSLPVPPAPPVAADNAVKTKPGTAVSIDVAGNDSDPDDDLDPSSVSVVDQPEHGTVEIDPDTFAIIYTPDPGFSGLDTLSYEICDSQPVCTTATVTITVELDTLAFTGVEPAAPAAAGVSALLLGILALLFGSRRRRGTARV